MLEIIFTTLFVAGAILTLVGYAFPGIDHYLPIRLQRYWLNTRFDSWSTVAVNSVNFFIRAADTAASATARASRKFLITVPVLLGAMMSIALLNPAGESSGDSEFSLFGRSWHEYFFRIDLIVVSILTIVALILIRFYQGPLVKIADLNRQNSMRASLSFEIRQISRLLEKMQSKISELQNDTSSDNENQIDALHSQIDFFQGYKKVLSDEIDAINNRISEIGNVDRVSAIGSTFLIFIISFVAFLLYTSVFILNIYNVIGETMFNMGPVDGFFSVLIISLPIFVMFLFVQSFVPSFLVLINPRNLMGRIRDQDSDDPLGQSSIFLFLFGITASLMLTYGAFVIGHMIDPAAYVPQTLQMIVSNAVFDGLTFALTLLIMRLVSLLHAESVSTLFVLLLLIIADLAIAALLAIGSIFFGLLGTEHAVSIGECVRVLIGLSPHEASLDFGPIFWVMHTAFIPTAIYLAFVGVMTLSKVVMSIALIISGKALVRGFMATGAVMATLAGIVQLFLM